MFITTTAARLFMFTCTAWRRMIRMNSRAWSRVQLRSRWSVRDGTAGLPDVGKFVLISLETPDSFVFDRFPNQIQSTDRANWEEQDVSIGTKPLFYSSTEPRKISVPELMLDSTRDGGDIGDQIDRLRKLKQETKSGAPPALLAIWGDRQQRCVMEEVTIAETFFTPAGDPLRARVSLQLVELQEQHEVVTSSVSPLDRSRTQWGISDAQLNSQSAAPFQLASPWLSRRE